MNNKDEEVFIAWVISEDNSEGLFSNMNSFTRDEYFAKAGFEVGLKHGRAELDELTSILDLKKETIVEMQSAYETLQAHNEMLIATVDKLKEENKKLVEALEFYGNETSWNDISGNCLSNVISGRDVEHIIGDSIIGGKLARQVLKEVGEE